jgi:hypothetical protein
VPDAGGTKGEDHGDGDGDCDCEEPARLRRGFGGLSRDDALKAKSRQPSTQTLAGVPDAGGTEARAAGGTPALHGAKSWLLGGVVLGAEEMERDVGGVTDDPAIVAGRAGGNVEERAGAEFVDGAVVEGGGGAAGEDQADVFDVAARGTNRGADVQGPLPAGLVGGAADGDAADADEFEFSFFEDADFVGGFETL